MPLLSMSASTAVSASRLPWMSLMNAFKVYFSRGGAGRTEASRQRGSPPSRASGARPLQFALSEVYFLARKGVKREGANRPGSAPPCAPGAGRPLLSDPTFAAVLLLSIVGGRIVDWWEFTRRTR